MYRVADPDLTYTAFNIRDPVIGGFAKEKIALRRAMAMAYNVEEQIKVIRKGQAMHVQMPIPARCRRTRPAVSQHHPVRPRAPRTSCSTISATRGAADGWRTLPDGKPLVLQLARAAEQLEPRARRAVAQVDASIGIRMEVQIAPLVDNIQAAKACKLQMWGQAWIADYPDGDNFMQLLYGPNTGQSNNGCYESKAFDASTKSPGMMPDSPSATGCSSK